MLGGVVCGGYLGGAVGGVFGGVEVGGGGFGGCGGGGGYDGCFLAFFDVAAAFVFGGGCVVGGGGVCWRRCGGAFADFGLFGAACFEEGLGWLYFWWC